MIGSRSWKIRPQVLAPLKRLFANANRQDAYSSIVVDHLKSAFVGADKVGIICIYFEYSHREEQTVANLMGSVLQQLVQRRGVLDDDIKTKYDDYTSPSVEECYSFILTQIEDLNSVYIVLDALDECSEDPRLKFLSKLKCLLPKVNIFMTSRFGTLVPRGFQQVKKLPIRVDEEDIRKYVKIRLEDETDMIRLGDFLEDDPLLETAIIQEVPKKAKGMCVFQVYKFLLIQILINVLFKVFISPIAHGLSVGKRGCRIRLDGS
jgi:hypothetical protein